MIGVYEIDFLTMTFVNVSQIICDGLGYTQEELVGQPVMKVLTPESIELMSSRIARMRKGEFPDGKSEFVAVCKSGALIPVAIEAFFKIENGNIVGALVAVREIKNDTIT